jgi:hypothetical protein
MCKNCLFASAAAVLHSERVKVMIAAGSDLDFPNDPVTK